MVNHDRDSVLIGGPYNGNSFYVKEGADEFRITYTSHSTQYSHVYRKTGDHRFTYDGTETGIADPLTGVKLDNPSGEDL